MAENVNDSRADRRVAVDAFVKVAGGDHEYVFRTRDVSRSGLFLYTKVGHMYPFKVGSTLQLELYDYDQFVTCRCVIVRVVEQGTPEAEKFPVGFGLRILQMTDEDRAKLIRMIERVDKDGSMY